MANRAGEFGSASAFTGKVNGPYLAQVLTQRLGYQVTQGEPFSQVFPQGNIPQSARSVGCWLDSQSGSGHTIAVTHPGIIRCAVVHALSAPLGAFWRVDISPLSLTDLRFNGRNWTVRCTACALDHVE